MALLQLDLVWKDVRANRSAIERELQSKPPERGSLVLSPEMADTGFVSEVVHDAIVDGREFASSISRRHGVWYLHGATERSPDGFGRNILIVADPEGDIRGVYRKIHPFGYGEETNGFRGGDEIAVIQAGDAVLAPFICYDLRFPEVWRHAALAGAEIFVIAANWPAARHAHWRSLCIARAIENQAFVVACNRVGKDPNAAYAGGSIVVSPQGDIEVEAGAEATRLESMLDLRALRAWRERFPALRDLRRRFLGRVPTMSRDSRDRGNKSH